jgi:hypothetical protein
MLLQEIQVQDEWQIRRTFLPGNTYMRNKINSLLKGAITGDGIQNKIIRETKAFGSLPSLFHWNL